MALSQVFTGTTYPRELPDGRRNRGSGGRGIGAEVNPHRLGRGERGRTVAKCDGRAPTVATAAHLGYDAKNEVHPVKAYF